MSKLLEKRISEVRRRCSVNLLLLQFATVGIGCAGLALLALVVDRLFGFDLWRRELAYGLLLLFGVGALGIWLARIPSRRQVSLVMDERLRFRDRFSTTLALAESDDPFAAAARDEAHRALAACHVEAHFPIRATRRWRWTAGSWALVLALCLWLPEKDLLGFLRRAEAAEQEKSRVALAQEEISDSADKVRQAVTLLDDPNLNDALAGLEALPAAAPPEEAKRQAIRKLANLSDKLKQEQASVGGLSMQQLREMLKQLKATPSGLSQELHRATARGQFRKASELLKDLQQRALEGELNSEQKEALQRQLEHLAQQMAELADAQQLLDEELEKLGLPKALARLDTEQLRDALQKQGLSAEEIDRFLKRRTAARMAANRCTALGQALGAGAAGGMSGEEMAAAMQQLDELDSLEQELKLSEAALARIDEAIACLGEGLCEGLGANGPYRPGVANRQGPGSGGPGRGFGAVESDSAGETSTKKARIDNQPKEGPVIASWYFQGGQVKGEARQRFKAVVSAGRDSASEAIQENEIPRKYEQSVKDYFGQLDAQTDAP